jgi:hypothetical protein
MQRTPLETRGTFYAASVLGRSSTFGSALESLIALLTSLCAGIPHFCGAFQQPPRNSRCAARETGENIRVTHGPTSTDRKGSIYAAVRSPSRSLARPLRVDFGELPSGLSLRSKTVEPERDGVRAKFGGLRLMTTCPVPCPVPVSRWLAGGNRRSQRERSSAMTHLCCLCGLL